MAATPEAERLLERHRPVLRYHSRERLFASAVDGRRHRAARGIPPRVYGHVAREQGQVWLQYWIFYASNPQDRGVARTGRHEGDWEFLQLRLGGSQRPVLATLAQHTWAEGCSWGRLRREGDAPVVFVANASHASYSRAGLHDRPFPDPNDEADGRGRRSRPRLEAIDDSDPAWVAWPGRWGRTRAAIWPGEASSPRGPRFQKDGRWARPASYHADKAVECASGTPWRPWQTVMVVLAALVAGASLLALRRRRRRARP